MQPIKVKLIGRAQDLEPVLVELEQIYYVTRTSPVIRHQEDQDAHIFAVLTEGRR